jgi:hypothetical protein
MIKSDCQLRQKRGEIGNLKHYAFTIDLVPHVFGDFCFAGHKYKYMERIHQKVLSNSDSRKGINRNAQQLNSSERNTNQGAAQDQSTSHHAKVVARGPG